MTTRKRVLVSGHVQGVFFRARTLDIARRLGVTGWVRNRPDGRVEAEFQGPVHAVDELVSFCKAGPDYARVQDVEVADADLVRGEARFEVR